MIFSSVNFEGEPGSFELKYKQHSQNQDKLLPINHHWNEFNCHCCVEIRSQAEVDP